MAALWLLSAVYFLVWFGAGPIQPHIAPHFADTGAPQWLAAMVVATVYGALCAGRFFSASIVARTGLRTGILIGLAGYVLYPAALAAGLSPYALLAVAAAWGFGGGIFWSASGAYLLSFAAPRSRGGWSGLVRLALQAGTVAGFLVLGAFPELSFRVRALTASAACASGLAVALSLPPAETRPERMSPVAVLRAAVSARFLRVGLYLLVSGAAFGLALNAGSQLLKARAGERFDFVMMLFYVVAGAMSWLGGKASDLLGRRMGFAIAFACGGAGACMLLGGGLVCPAAGRALRGGAFGLATTVANAWAGDESPPGMRTSAIAAAFAWRDVGILAAIMLRGMLSARVTLSFFAAAYALALLSVPLSRKRR